MLGNTGYGSLPRARAGSYLLNAVDELTMKIRPHKRIFPFEPPRSQHREDLSPRHH